MSTIVANSLNYVGDGIMNGVTRFTERSAGVLAFFRSITGSITSNVTSKRTAVKWKVILPFPAAEPESCPCDGSTPYSDTIVNIDIRFDSRTDLAHRTAVLTTIRDLVATTQYGSSVTGLVTPN